MPQPGPAVYRHKPTTITAMQYTPDNVPALRQWLTDGGADFAEDGSHLHIQTREGLRHCKSGEGYWIVQGIADEWYCIAPDVFTAAYELPVDGA